MGKLRWSFWLELVAWWVVLVVVYLASLGTAPTSEYVAASAAGLASAVLAVAARRAAGAGWRLPRQLGRAVAVLPLALLGDAVRTLGLLLRPRTLHRTMGALDELTVPEGSQRATDGRLALGSALISSTPGSLVIDDDPDEGRLRVHRLVHSSPDPAQEVVRK